MKLKWWQWVIAAGVLCGFLAVLFLHRERDPEGLLGVEAANPADSPHKARADALVKAACDWRYFTAVSGLQWLRTDSSLNEEQLTALQDAIGKIQSRLSAAAQNGDPTAVRHFDALQNETDYREK